MSDELTIMKMFVDDKDYCEKYSAYILNISNITKDIRTICKLIRDYYDKYSSSASSIKEAELVSYYSLLYPKSKDFGRIKDIICEMYAIDVTNINVVTDLVERIIESNKAADIMNKVIPIVEGTKSGCLHEIKDDIDDYLKQLREPPPELAEIIPCTMSLNEIVEQDKIKGLTWTLPKLNAGIGGLKGSSNGLIFAFVDSGKTSFGIQQCVNFAHQLRHTDDIVLYLGNEEASFRVLFRMMVCLANKEKGWFHAHPNPDNVDAWLQKQGLKNIKLYDSVTHIKTVEKLVDKHHPKIVFIDQGTKIHYPPFQIGDVTTMGLVFNRYRELGKEYECDVISLAQAAAAGENKEFLSMTDLFNNKVTINAELDYSIAIGRKIDDDALKEVRYFNIPKNKYGDNLRFTTYFDRNLCRFIEN